ncbi:methylated-DNA--[protein]-cysteine S-methyltransferase [Marinitenerispora sediminis]|uniref:methylated-DNA--[protein]-cysteine S-methyltransferase n=1 Tax=Marinitenerispora sediminis TaxID=1931232 RepID=UPI0013142F05|nr:methylated-DNA--[protein]-cysteine S-methyltransferase [Marinitenerispora sediminis]
MTRTWREGRSGWHGATRGAEEVDGDLDALIRATATTPAASTALPARPRPTVRPAQHDVVIGTAETPVGFLTLALTQRGLVSCSFDSEDSVLPRLSRAVSADIGRQENRLDPVRRELNAYFEGRLTSFSIPLDLRLTSDFGRVVLRSLLDVPWGATLTHARLAERIGRGNAGRAVANTLATNPICVLLPCHRIVPEDYPAEVGCYAGGPDAKRYLLTLERFKHPGAFEEGA